MIEMATPQFAGRYASIRKAVWKDTLGSKYTPGKDQFVNGHWKSYKTEKGYYNAQAKAFEERMKQIDRIEDAGIPTNATIIIDRRKGSMGAWQAKADLRYSYVKDGIALSRSIEGTRTGGVGYDKTSSAMANVLNKSPEFVRLLADARVKSKKLPYGADLYAGKPYLPAYSWGVGASSINAVLRALGYDVREHNVGDNTLYEYTLKRRRA